MNSRIRHRERSATSALVTPFTSRLVIEYRATTDLKRSRADLRRYDKRFQEHLAPSIRRFGFILPVVVDRENRIVHGHQLVLAAETIGLREVPTVKLDHLTPEDARALRIALHKLEEHSCWNDDVLTTELQFLIDYNVDLATYTAFSSAEIDALLYAPPKADPKRSGRDDPDDALPALTPAAVSRPGDLWTFAGGHRLACANALEEASFTALMDDEQAGLVLSDPPFNVSIRGNVTTRKDAREFAMASGDLPRAGYIEFLRKIFERTSRHAREGALSYQFIDWRHISEMQTAGEAIYSKLLNVCVWAKTNGGQGSFYRSAHELCFVWKIGDAPHINNIELGRNGRNRTNVWSYPGANVPRPAHQRIDEDHVTPKNVGMIQDAILDASRPSDIILDVFAGSGTTLVAAHRARRRGYGMEIDPIYVDRIIRRMERVTGRSAHLSESGATFAEVAAMRHPAPAHSR